MQKIFYIEVIFLEDSITNNKSFIAIASINKSLFNSTVGNLSIRIWIFYVESGKSEEFKLKI